MKNLVILLLSIVPFAVPALTCAFYLQAPAALAAEAREPAVLVHDDVPSVPAVEPGVSTAEPTGDIAVPSPAHKVVTSVHGRKAPHAVTSGHSLRFVCGAAYDNSVGGRNSDCKWL